MFKRFLIFIVIYNFYFSVSAADTLITTKLLNRLEELQSKESAVFPKGSFPTYRQYALNKEFAKADINAFYSGLIAMTLKDIKHKLTDYQQIQASRIIRNITPYFEKFKNQNGRNTYNFWPKDTPIIFPNAGFLNLFNKRQALPDDLDDTVVILLALNTPDSIAKNIHLLMQDYTNTGDRKINNTFKEYRNIGAYSTWFGKIIPIDFDISVLSNVLLFVQKNNLKWTKADSASLDLIVKNIIDRRYVTNAPYVSPHYAKTAYILYHFSRLMSYKPIKELEIHKDQLIRDALTEFNKAESFLDEVVLSTALNRWGVKPPNGKFHYTDNLQEFIEDPNFYFFTANIAAMMPDEFKRFISKIKLGLFFFNCPGYNNVLLLENILLNNNN
ncbi:MAG: hypothetical protein WCO37_12860 [Bacteroidota bacterium]|jgi:hypothetical protein